MTEQSDLLTRAREWLGREATAATTARDPVNQAMIRRWAEAMGDANPLWHDPAARAEQGFDTPVAPPAMLEVWTMAPYRPAGRTEEEGMAVLKIFDDAGYFGVVATNIEQEYIRYLREGDVISYRTVISEISDEKKTGLGTGHFVTIDYEFTDQNDELVGRMKFRVLKFRPPEKAAAPEKDTKPKKFAHPRPAITHDNAFFWDGLKERKLLIQSFGGRLVHPPVPACPETGSFDWTTVEASGRGTIHSFVVMHHPQLPGFAYPLPVALVELAEGVRIVANMIAGTKVEDVAIGKPVTLDFVEVEPDYVLPAFRLA
ncbi:bifunctional MaoC family dehydratase N-terminal/OB-fold nucleic acid binding domain-containing protein [Sphingomonas sp. C3-2]|uniref:bifunctional MaoC family dehydratase N-terminal/OB-fold nucleic acid binding domain-containing protein n=1 Tax=Sphingomonas sp. C3-2 TaxID=3062169 RepID=UPI00294A9C05|nr:MaoC family dehydratase N-terminal domain-containing protein [Sphingomonas sp. C3-2]WOK36205.1 MaoC family dehydratase N-terminal domain-containing protein [Sphingomonas sp. C3-2]